MEKSYFDDSEEAEQTMELASMDWLCSVHFAVEVGQMMIHLRSEAQARLMEDLKSRPMAVVRHKTMSVTNQINQAVESCIPATSGGYRTGDERASFEETLPAHYLYVRHQLVQYLLRRPRVEVSSHDA